MNLIKVPISSHPIHNPAVAATKPPQPEKQRKDSAAEATTAVVLLQSAFLPLRRTKPKSEYSTEVGIRFSGLWIRLVEVTARFVGRLGVVFVEMKVG